MLYWLFWSEDKLVLLVGADTLGLEFMGIETFQDDCDFLDFYDILLLKLIRVVFNQMVNIIDFVKLLENDGLDHLLILNDLR